MSNPTRAVTICSPIFISVYSLGLLKFKSEAKSKAKFAFSSVYTGLKLKTDIANGGVTRSQEILSEKQKHSSEHGTQ